jgi:Tol biopolymer transport system component/tRNA A-37 threonylcarbamoyl transferase component Bud32
MIGRKLSHFEITAELGRGGMGEVYRATDSKLGREVAIKVLPEEFVADEERLARFEREARVLAALDHSNIAAIYGLEEVEGRKLLVMQLAEGETLAERIDRGPVPLTEALRIALQLAEALEAAHEKGIIHRDLKPANVKVTPDGQVKVLDFGLAKALASEPAAESPDLLARSPTLTARMTSEGVVLGTAAYMSPEQAKGEEADTRADIWAFGCVLWEMLTGERPFRGDSVPETMARVLEREPEWDELPDAAGPAVERLLRRCLRKEPSERLRHIGDARLEIIEAASEPDDQASASVAPRGRSMAVVVATAVVAAAVAGFAVWSFVAPEEPPAPRPSRWVFEPPDGGRFVALGGEGPWLHYPPIAVSADGALLAYSAAVGSEPVRLWLRSTDELEAREVLGSDRARMPFFSPDGRWLGFWKDGALQRARVEGGRPEKIADLSGTPRGVAWTTDDAIVFGGGNTGLMRVVAGGEPVEITRPDVKRLEQYHAWPSELPNGGIVFTVVTGDWAELAVLTPDGEIRVLPDTQGASQPRYLDSGHLVFFRSGGLEAAPFDLAASELSGATVPFVADVLTGWNAGLDLGLFAVSDAGDLVHFVGDRGLEENRIVLVDRQGEMKPLPGDRSGKYSYRPAVSPDGMHLAVTNRTDRPSGDVWVRDLGTGSEQRLTRGDRSVSIRPVWSTDGSHLYFAAYNATDNDPFDIYRMRPDGSDVELVLNRPYDQFPHSVSRDFLLFEEYDSEKGGNLYLLPLAGDGEPRGLATTPAHEFGGSFSPDGRFVAYVSDDSGRAEIYVKPVDGSSAGRIVSTNGGISPRWSPEGDQLFYLSGSMMAVSVVLEPSFRASSPRELFVGAFDREFDVVRAGPHFVPGDTRFVMLTLQRPNLTRLVVSLDWGARLRTLAD